MSDALQFHVESTCKTSQLTANHRHASEAEQRGQLAHQVLPKWTFVKFLLFTAKFSSNYVAQKAGNGTIGVKILKFSQAPRPSDPLDHPSTNTFRVLAHPKFSSPYASTDNQSNCLVWKTRLELTRNIR